MAVKMITLLTSKTQIFTLKYVMPHLAYSLGFWQTHLLNASDPTSSGNVQSSAIAPRRRAALHSSAATQRWHRNGRLLPEGARFSTGRLPALVQG